MSIQQTTATTTNANVAASGSAASTAPLKLSSEHDSSSSSQDEPQQAANAPLSPSEPSLPVTPGTHSSSSSSSVRSSMKSKKSTAAKKKKVLFNQAVTARPSIHKNNYTQKELAATWYNQREFEDIRRDVLKTLTLVRSGQLLEPEDIPAKDDCCADDASTVATEQSNSQSNRGGKPGLMRRNSGNGSYRSRSSKGTTNIYQSNRRCQKCVSTARGLENYTPKGSIKSSVRRLRQNAVWAIMEEQDLQVDRAEALEMSYLWYDADAIREVYRKHSKQAQRAARLLGMADAGVGTDKPAAAPTARASRRHTMTAAVATKKTFRKLFSSSLNSEEKLIKKAAAAFSSDKSTRASSSTATTTTKQRRWSLLVGSGRRGSLSAEGPRSPAAQVA